MCAFLILLAIPRVARILYPQVWIEDESYLNGAFLMSRGFLPYRDFPLPHLPALELLLASIFRVAPITIRTAEVFTQCAAFAGSVLVFLLGRRLAGAATGYFAALIFATSALLFRYHVFEREVFLVVPVLAAVFVASTRPFSSGESASVSAGAVTAGALMFAALAVKLTAVSAFVALALQLWIERRRYFAAMMSVTTVALLGLTTIALTARFRTNFIVQVFLFRAVHAAFPSLVTKLDELRFSMDISLALGLAGTALIVMRGEARRWLPALLQLASGFVFLVLLNPTFWPHTGIELLPWLSLTGGYLLATVFRAVTARADRRRAATRNSFTWASAAGAVLLVLFVTPIRNVNWEAGDGSAYGFGYRDRREIDTLAQFVRAHAAEAAAVATPQMIAFAANRRELVPYPEIAGEIDELTAIVRRDGYRAALTDDALRGRSFWDSVAASRDRSAPLLDRALSARRVAVVINDSPADLMPILLVDVPDEQLEADGYRLETGTSHYEAWIPR